MTYVQELRDAVGPRPLLLAGVGVLAFDSSGRLLLQRRSDDGTWAIVGGLLELGEAPDEALRREVREEVGLEVGELELYGVFAGPDYFHDYPGQGRVYGVNVIYRTRDIRGAPRPDRDEVCAVRFFAPHEIPADLEQTTRLILEHAGGH